MAKVVFYCDGCGAQEEGFFVRDTACKPRHWYIRSDDDGPQLVCSRECIDKVAAATGKTRVVMPL